MCNRQQMWHLHRSMQPGHACDHVSFILQSRAQSAFPPQIIKYSYIHYGHFACNTLSHADRSANSLEHHSNHMNHAVSKLEGCSVGEDTFLRCSAAVTILNQRFVFTNEHAQKFMCEHLIMVSASEFHVASIESTCIE